MYCRNIFKVSSVIPDQRLIFDKSNIWVRKESSDTQ